MPDLFITFGWFRVRIVRPPVLFLYLGPVLQKSITISEGTGDMDIALGDNQTRAVHVVGKDAAGMPSGVPVNMTWAIADPTIATVTPDATGANCVFSAASPPKLGTTTATATDNDSPSIAPLTFNVIVTAEDVTDLTVTIDPPVEKPAA